jgi:hypothetical protein
LQIPSHHKLYLSNIAVEHCQQLLSHEAQAVGSVSRESREGWRPAPAWWRVIAGSGADSGSKIIEESTRAGQS